jgi:hypothetical protein
MKLDTLLSASEMTAFNDLVLAAAAGGAGAIRYHSVASAIVVIGICDQAELLTWYCAPAHGTAEAVLAQSVILAGLAATSDTVLRIQGTAATAAHEAIHKASKMN